MWRWNFSQTRQLSKLPGGKRSPSTATGSRHLSKWLDKNFDAFYDDGYGPEQIDRFFESLIVSALKALKTDGEFKKQPFVNKLILGSQYHDPSDAERVLAFHLKSMVRLGTNRLSPTSSTTPSLKATFFSCARFVSSPCYLTHTAGASVGQHSTNCAIVVHAACFERQRIVVFLHANMGSFSNLSRITFTKEAEQTNRFSLADFMILMALVSLATALGASAPINRDSQNWVLISCLNLLVISMWYKCVKLMDSSGIRNNTSRIAMQVFVYPSAILSLSLLITCTLVVGVGAIASLVPNYNNPIERNLFWNFVLLIASAGWVHLTRVAFIAILNRNQPRNVG